MKNELKKGVKKLYLAELFSLFGGVIISIASTNLSSHKTLEAVFGLAGFALILVSSILHLVGLINLRKENKKFNEAFWTVLVIIGWAILDTIIPAIWPNWSGDPSNLLYYILQVSLSFAIIDGIRESIPAVAKLGKTTYIIYAISAFTNLAILALGDFGVAADSTPIIITGILSIIAELIYGIIIIVLLGKANSAVNKK